MGKKQTAGKSDPKDPVNPKKELAAVLAAPAGKPSSLLDTRVIYCGLRRAQS
jgi:hypothetical protein